MDQEREHSVCGAHHMRELAVAALALEPLLRLARPAIHRFDFNPDAARRWPIRNREHRCWQERKEVRDAWCLIRAMRFLCEVTRALGAEHVDVRVIFRAVVAPGAHQQRDDGLLLVALERVKPATSLPLPSRGSSERRATAAVATLAALKQVRTSARRHASR